MRLTLRTLAGDRYEVEASEHLTLEELIHQFNEGVGKTHARMDGVRWQVFRPGSRRILSEDAPLGSLNLTSGESLLLVRECQAAAYRNPREDRLRWERLDLEELNRESETVHVQPIHVQPGSEPEEYRITLKCKGILRIDSQRQPVYGYTHQVLMHCGDDFPTASPVLYWETDIWHPNIDHKSKGVCINAKEWVGSRSLRDVCRQIFEMVQYKSYHAINQEPFPLDHEVARWVLEFGEPQKVVDKSRGIFVDNRPFLRPTYLRRIKERTQAPAKPKQSRLRLVDSPSPPAAASKTPSKISRLKLAGQ